MEICKVMGNAWATKKEPSLNGQRFLILKKMVYSNGIENGVKNGLDEGDANTITLNNQLLVAIDNIGAGVGDLVLVARGSGARVAGGGQSLPIDAAIIGIVDSIDVH